MNRYICRDLSEYWSGKTLVLAMIVKDEAKTILKCLESIYPYLDYWVIDDVGSTDGTLDLIRNFFKDKGIAGELNIAVPFQNYSHNRTSLVQRAKGKADYTLMIDADQTIEVKDRYFKYKLNSDYGYLLPYKGTPPNYLSLNLLNNSRNWEYKGYMFEYARCVDGDDTFIKIAEKLSTICVKVNITGNSDTSMGLGNHSWLA